MIPIIKIRSIGIFFFLCFCYLIVFCNLIYLQLLQHSFFKVLGNKQYHVTVTHLPPRGSIIDRAGKNYLAINKDSLSAFILPRQIEMREKLEKFLNENFPGALKRLINNADTHFIYVHRKLTDELINRIKKSGISDIKFLSEPSRYYPLPAAANIIGMTDIDNKGLFGLELFYDKQLSGEPTTVTLEKDARSNNFYFKKETTRSGKEPQPLQLTIDSDLQFIAFEAISDAIKKFSAQEGAAVIIDPTNGDILAMVNVPSFDPNNFIESDLSITKNKVITDAYELGSVFKIFSALAALEEKIVTPEELIDCKNSKTAYIDGRKINTVHEAGIISFEEVIATSNNIGIAQVAKRIDSKLYEHYCRLGFGKKSGISFPGENKGFINPPSQWSKQSIISLSYGYEISANLLQLARAFSIIANDGYWVDLRLTFNQLPSQKKQKLYSDNAVEITKKLLERTTAQGTARKANIKGYKIMCKTGTANILENGVYNPDKNLYTCGGIIEKNDYKRVIVIFIKEAAEKNLYASTVAAPIFEQIAQNVLIKDRII